MRALIPIIAALALLSCALPSEAQVDGRRWIVQTSDGKLIGFTDDQDVDPPDAAFATFVLESVIRAATPPGATGEILPLGTWIAGVYTAPSGGGIVEHIDPTTDQGSVQEAVTNAMDVLEGGLAFIQDNRHVWSYTVVEKATEGIHWQIINMARVALNSTRTAANRVKFAEEVGSWPVGSNGGVLGYLDLWAAAIAGDENFADPAKDFSWVNPEADPPARNADLTTAASGFGQATNVEDAPTSADLIARGWIADVP